MARKKSEHFHIITLSFEDNLKAYQLFSQLKQYHVEGQIELQQIVVIEREENGSFAFKDAADLSRSNTATKGALIGMAVGILGGPFGVLFGTLTGGMIGTSKELKRLKSTEELFKKTIGNIELGTTGIIAIGKEYEESVLDGLVDELGGKVTRTDEEL
ncbi:hypothetical protein AUC31_11530 [Planococcus rifietoensis]|uniref:DUF1269 domain-containing protein n=1 Tax=Planococcus rifietoensis TaxID=200991 RepID=A0A0U2Z9A6_9BACL|nr:MULTISPECIES: hypothetical protein [Planococcus]ALS75788.1 hypothetical protein AUC31_11530 [Planococcus rifietoensis]MDE0582281.1 hypothetical protein [Planococcus sp. A6]